MGRRRVQGSAAADTAHTPSHVPVTAIAHNPRNPRIAYDDVNELAESLAEYGVLQPLGVVRYEIYLGRHPEFEAEIGAAHWVVLHGNRRLAAARQAEVDEVPVIVHERLGREDVFDESSLVENVHRQDLPPLQEAALLRELCEKYGSQRKLAAKLKKSQGYISQRLSLFDLVPDLQSKVVSGELSFAGARELAGIRQEVQLDAYQAGVPYRDPTSSKHPTNNKSSPPAARGDQSSVRPADGSGDYGVISAEPAPTPPPAPAVPDYAANTGADTSPEPTTDYAVISAPSAEEKPSPPRKFPAPDTLAPQLRDEYSPEEREKLAQLLLD